MNLVINKIRMCLHMISYFHLEKIFYKYITIIIKCANIYLKVKPVIS